MNRIETISEKRKEEIVDKARELVKGKVSIISAFCPSNNIPSEAEQVVKSFLNTQHNFELILIDNECPKDTMSAIEKIVNNDERVRIVRNLKNTGYSGGFNDGICNASTDVYLFIESDRVIDPDCVDAVCNDLSLGLFYETFFTKDIVNEIKERYFLLSEYMQNFNDSNMLKLEQYCRCGKGMMDENMFFIPADDDYRRSIIWSGFDNRKILNNPAMEKLRKPFGRKYPAILGTNNKTSPNADFERFCSQVSSVGWGYYRAKWNFIDNLGDK